MTLLVSAASGHLGRLVIDALLARGVAASDVVAGVRTPPRPTTSPRAASASSSSTTPDPTR